ncbi:hypothetical protein HYT57_05745 [Candidatus Woesearchaeota archaeon]|nr:hypothetical protein [Candidatus Woesearchaeota archaeon]
MLEDIYKVVANRIKIVNIFIVSSNCAIDNPIANVALVKDKISGAHPGQAEVKNAGIIAKYPYLFL